MSVPKSMSTAFDRARRYQRLSKCFLDATENDATLMPENPPYETQYGTPHVFAQSEELADIAAFYKACGLSAPLKEREDHLAVELEFMAFLIQKEAYALYRGDAGHAAQMRELQGKFMVDHLGRWVPSFAGRFEAREPSLAKDLREWVAADVKVLGVTPAEIRAIDLRPALGTEESLECGGGACEL